MSSVAARLPIPGAQLSIVADGTWSLQSAPSEQPEGLGSFLLHTPSGIFLNVRRLDSHWALSGADLTTESGLADMFTRYSEISWSGRRTTRVWAEGELRGVTGVFEDAMPDAVVREWVVTDGSSLANAATFATTRQWAEMLGDCEKLVRSIRFDR